MSPRAALAAAGALALAIAAAGLGLVQAQTPPGGANEAAPADQTPAAAPAKPPALANAVTRTRPPRPLRSAPPQAEVEAPLAADATEEAAPPPPPPPPLKRPRYGAAILQAVDKITAQTLRFEAKIGQPVRYRDLVLTVHACETTASDEPMQDSIAHLQVDSEPVTVSAAPAAPRQVFKGWMFASSPTLHPFEHPIYDVWLIACKTETAQPSA